MKNMRSGFTMIELVFVIVIIGILSAVALPKFLGTSNQAHDAVVKGFAGTLNRTVGPTLWSKSITEENSGLITSYCGDMATYIDVPDELTDDGACGFTPTADKGATLSITFADGSAVAAPTWTIDLPTATP